MVDEVALATPALLKLLALVSPALPIGAFAYSQGLETAIEQRWLKDAADVRAWLTGVLHASLARVDLPVLHRLCVGFREGAETDVVTWNGFLLASRGAQELRAEDAHLGQALLRVLRTLDVAHAFTLGERLGVGCAYATAFALAAQSFDIPPATAALGFAFAWAETQVSAAVRLVPLGQSDGVRILHQLGPALALAADASSSYADEDIGSGAPALAAVSALHETQYSRLFRS